MTWPSLSADVCQRSADIVMDPRAGSYIPCVDSLDTVGSRCWAAWRFARFRRLPRTWRRKTRPGTQRRPGPPLRASRRRPAGSAAPGVRASPSPRPAPVRPVLGWSPGRDRGVLPHPVLHHPIHGEPLRVGKAYLERLTIGLRLGQPSIQIHPPEPPLRKGGTSTPYIPPLRRGGSGGVPQVCLIQALSALARGTGVGRRMHRRSESRRVGRRAIPRCGGLRPAGRR